MSFLYSEHLLFPLHRNSLYIIPHRNYSSRKIIIGSSILKCNILKSHVIILFVSTILFSVLPTPSLICYNIWHSVTHFFLQMLAQKVNNYLPPKIMQRRKFSLALFSSPLCCPLLLPAISSLIFCFQQRSSEVEADRENVKRLTSQ